jgi:hypothetical protein
MRYLVLSVLLLGLAGTAEAQTSGPAGPGIAYGQSVPLNPGIAYAPPTPMSPPIAVGPAYSPGAAMGPPMTGYGTPGLLPYHVPAQPVPYGVPMVPRYDDLPDPLEEMEALEP